MIDGGSLDLGQGLGPCLGGGHDHRRAECYSARKFDPPDQEISNGWRADRRRICAPNNSRITDMRHFLALAEADETLNPKDFGVQMTREEGVALLRSEYRLA